MNKTDFCRLCANLANYACSKLFERRQRKLLQQVKEITGLQLKNTKYLPRLICQTCKEQTLQAHEFREICIRAQQHFTTEQLRTPTTIKPVKRRRRIKNGDDDAYESSTEKAFVATETCQIKAADLSETKNEPKTESVALMQIAQAEDVLHASGNSAKGDTMISEKVEITTDTTATDKLKTTTRKFPQKAKSNLICDQCGRHFKCRSNFVIHMRRHTGDKPFKCEICPQKFNANWDLKRHVRNHTGELPYPCRYCERRFREISSRTRHERNHTNVRPFACTQCDKSFTQSQNLKNHMLTHTGVRAFDCKMCNVSFKRKTHLVTHYRTLMHKQNEEKQKSSLGVDAIQECDINQQCLNI